MNVKKALRKTYLTCSKRLTRVRGWVKLQGTPLPAEKPSTPPSFSAAERDRWWPAGIAGLGLALTILTFWVKKRNDGNNTRKQ
jgi:hypothetical protein